jgi:asparagine N-glycosylation enzyme membrane subunit Stt3
VLIAGDAFALLVVSALGFATHDEIRAESLDRFPATYLPFLAAWILAALATGALNPRLSAEARQLWRPLAAAVLAAPLGAVLRGAWLGSPVLPIFVAVMTLATTAGYLAWRCLLLALRARNRS